MDEPELTPFLLDKAGDVVVERGDHQLVVRCVKRYQEFVPQPALDSLDPFQLVLGGVFGMLRKIPPRFTDQWQAGVIRVPLKGSERWRVLTKQKFPDAAAAEAHRDELERQVRRGDFDKKP